MIDWTVKTTINAMNAVDPTRPLTPEEERRLDASLRIAEYMKAARDREELRDYQSMVKEGS
jgi:hypothetical protein